MGKSGVGAGSFIDVLQAREVRTALKAKEAKMEDLERSLGVKSEAIREREEELKSKLKGLQKESKLLADKLSEIEVSCRRGGDMQANSQDTPNHFPVFSSHECNYFVTSTQVRERRIEAASEKVAAERREAEAEREALGRERRETELEKSRLQNLVQTLTMKVMWPRPRFHSELRLIVYRSENKPVQCGNWRRSGCQ